jgi:transcription initiation factor TFIID TATA-box-binding protein
MSHTHLFQGLTHESYLLTSVLRDKPMSHMHEVTSDQSESGLCADDMLSTNHSRLLLFLWYIKTPVSILFTDTAMEYTPYVTNISATFSLGCRVSLNTIGRKCWNVEWAPKKFNGLIMRLREPKCTASIFASGKVVMCGLLTEEDATTAAWVITMELATAGLSTCVEDVKIQNIAGALDLKRPINLVRLAQDNPYNASYETELFPGLIWRFSHQPYSLTIFRTGKMIITGCKTVPKLKELCDFVVPLIDMANRPKGYLHPSIEYLLR